MNNPEQFQTKTILSGDAGTTVLVRSKAGATSDGILGYVMVLVADAHTVTLYDGVDNTGDLIATLPASLSVGTYFFRRPVKKGLAAVVAASFAGNYIVGYL